MRSCRVLGIDPGLTRCGYAVVDGSGPGAAPNGILEPGEECDDGNLDDADGCTRFCRVGGCFGDIDLDGEVDDQDADLFFDPNVADALERARDIGTALAHHVAPLLVDDWLAGEFAGHDIGAEQEDAGVPQIIARGDHRLGALRVGLLDEGQTGVDPFRIRPGGVHSTSTMRTSAAIVKVL